MNATTAGAITGTRTTERNGRTVVRLVVPRRISIFAEHIRDLKQGTSNQWCGTCPFCEKPRHFYVNERTTCCDCKRCGWSGNKRKFLHRLREIEKTVGGEGGGIPPKLRATVQPSSLPAAGCSLQEYGQEKRLPIEFLKSCGLSEITYDGKPAIRIPHFRPDGSVTATKYRIRLLKSRDGHDRFRWKAGDKATLYGLDRLHRARSAGYVVIVEGPSDCHTLWHHGEPAIGIPGAGSWQEAWADYLSGIPIIYVVIEPDHGGETVKAWITRSSIRDRVRLVFSDPFKDPSDMHVAEPKRFKARWRKALRAAVPFSETANRELRERTRQTHRQCHQLVKSRNILARFVQELRRRGVVGEDRVMKLLYLACTSRLLDWPVNVAVKGPSSGGKSYLVDRTLQFFPQRRTTRLHP